jgi:molybdenum cofactor cytidylyltransferase
MACDQPFVTAKAIDALARALTRSTVTIAASAYADTLGVPALFRRKWFPKLQTLPDAAGAKRLLAACPKETVPVAFPDGVHDIDFPIDLHRLIAIQRERQRNISTFPKVTSVD